IFVVQLISYSAQAQKNIFLKEFQFSLDEISENQYENEYFITLTLNKGSLYKFTVLNHIGDFPGEAIVQVLDNEKVVVTNTLNDKYYEKFMLKCNKTGYYDLLIHFDKNKIGSSLIKLFLVK
ncbi:MAG: hypothetical protein PF487_13310, partial [Bacteroidales bacterium]|nr:hypothetical protein [Bacteroidales bacterium]